MNESKQTYILLALILITGLVLSRILYASPFYSFDDANYILFAHQILSGGFNPASSPYAYGFLLPVSLAISFAIFGTNVLASILPAIIEYLILIILAFEIGRKLYGKNIGLISAFLIATAPFVVGYSTRVLPDMGVGLLAGLSILLFIHAQESKNGKSLYLLSGASAALTIYFKMIGLAYLLFFLIVMLFYAIEHKPKSKMNNNAHLYSFAGIFAAVVVYVIILFLYSGSIFGPFLAYGNNQSIISPSNLGHNIHTLLVLLFGYANPNGILLGPVQDAQTFPLGLIIFWALVGTVIALYRRDRKLTYLSTLLWGAFLYLLFGTLTLTKYSFVYVVSRYFILVSVPMAVLAAYAIWMVYIASRPLLKSYNKYLLVLIIAVVMVSNIPIYRALYNYNLTISGDTRTFSSALKYLQSTGHNITIFTSDNYTTNLLEFLSSYSKAVHISTLNLSNRVVLTDELSKICKANAENTYLAFSYDNYSILQYKAIFDAWIKPGCDLTGVGTFSDNASSKSIDNSTNVRIALYRVN